MIITREIKGETVEIELTEQELSRAYFESQMNYDRDDMEYYVSEYEDDITWFEENFKVKFEEAFTEDAFLEMGCTMRHLIDDHEMSWDYARGEALQDWCREYLESKEVV